MSNSASPTASNEPASPVDRKGRLRLLLPVTQDPDSCWGWRYALAQQEHGLAVEVCLLHVTKRIEYCEVIRGAQVLPLHQGTSLPEMPHLEEAIATFDQAGIPARGFLAAGGRVEVILEMAEFLECDEIVMPLNDRPKWSERFWCSNTVLFVQQRARGVPVVTVDAAGHAVISINACPRNKGLAA